MSAPKLTVREVVAVLRRAWDELSQPQEPDAAKWVKLSDAIVGVLNRYEAEVVAEEREEHRRALEAAESEAVEPW